MFQTEDAVRLLALAASLESEGQYNNAKLLRAAVDSLLTQAAYRSQLPADRPSLQMETARAIVTLSGLDIESTLLDAIKASHSALAAGRLPSYHETPDPYVCRICGHLNPDGAPACPVCGADSATFKRFRPIYWIEALDPFESLALLHATPRKVASLLEFSSGSPVEEEKPGSGWSLRQAISHLNDAQGVLAYRVNLILDQDNPVLESKAVFEWANNETEKPPSVQELFDTYCTSRQQTVSRLESIPLSDWWRRGQHEEFGELRLYEQVSYFASHERTHFAQIERLAEGQM